MAKKRILLTGDDGYNSLGTRLVIDALKNSYDLSIAGTLRQQSGVGSTMSLESGFEWGSDIVDGVSALWVDGSPVDAIELAACYFEQPFDLVISGVNWGANIGAAVSASGTLGAAQRALAVELAPNSIAVSWDVPLEFYRMAHNGVDALDEYLEYPGKFITPLIEKAMKEKYWGAQLLNINFPNQPTKKAKITSFALKMKDIYQYPSTEVDASEKSGHFEYKGQRKMNKHDQSIDLGAVNAGFISITPCKFDYLDDDQHAMHKEVSFLID